MKVFLVIIPFLLVGLATVGQVLACQHSVNSIVRTNSINASQTVFQIAAESVPCTGLVPMRCLVVNGELFYNVIDGYEHHEGIGRVIKIERIQICDPDVFNSCPQDVSIYRYRLVEVIK